MPYYPAHPPLEREGEMNATDFLDMILDKHHGGYLPEEESERDPLWEKDRIESLSNGYAWTDDIDK